MRTEILLDFDWLFNRGDAPGAQRSSYDDSRWRKVDLPHDWSIEDLPPREAETSFGSVIDLTRGVWRTKAGDDRRWKDPDLNESGWSEIRLPRHCHPSIGPLPPKSYGWYRQRVEIPRKLKGRRITIYVGRADDVDEVFFNGTRIGGTGRFPPKYSGEHHIHRLYPVPARLVRKIGGNTVAVRVYTGRNHGGLFQGAGRGRSGPFDSESAGGPGVGHAVGGIGWYRKKFLMPLSHRRRVYVDFDGVYMNSEVWLNGHRLGGRPFGYTPFGFDLTSHLNLRGINVLAVKVRNVGKNCRWYSGSGIYRHVRLKVVSAVHVAPRGVYVTTLKASTGSATVKCETTVANGLGSKARAEVVTRIVDREGRSVSEARRNVTLGRGPSVIRHELKVVKPRRWSLESPYLYSVVSEVVVDGVIADATTTPFGIRTISFDAKKGFRLNGRTVLLKGGCVHHDNGPLGACAYGRADERRVEIMKRSGFNAIRTSHNPPSASFLDACDRTGMLVIDELFDQWKVGSNPEDYSNFFGKWWKRDVDAMVLRDRNHASVIMWSIGNEIGEQATEQGLKIARQLAGRIRKLDPTRAVTQGINGGRRGWRSLDRLFGALDVGGYNYARDHYVEDHKLFPRRVMYASESFSIQSYEFWKDVEKYPWVIGDFVWTGYDYLGEAGIGWSPDWVYMYPWTVAYCGEIDLIGNKTPASYYRDALWNKGDSLSLFVHFPKNRFEVPLEGKWSWAGVLDSWNWAGSDGKSLKVVAYTSCDRVVLKLNGRNLGAREIRPENRLTAEWDVPYEPGALVATGFRKGRKVMERTLRTAGTPKKIRLTPDRDEIRADGQDLSYISVTITDAKGIRHPGAENAIRFGISGAGVIAAVGSAKPTATESFQRKARKAWEGRCQVIVKSLRRGGKITLTATSAGLAPASVVIRAV